MTDSWERARRVLGAAGIPPGDLAHLRPLGGGTYNLVEELTLTDGTRHVLKTAPTAPGLSHERQLLVSEADFYGAAAKAGVAAPRVVALDGDTLLMTRCPGGPWDDTLTEPEVTGLRTELGRQVARLHEITGPGFGYPSGALGPSPPTGAPRSPRSTTPSSTTPAATTPGCRSRRRHRPHGPVGVRGPGRGHRPACRPLRPVAGQHPRRRATGTPRIGGLVDGERMFWGDPLADFVSLALLGTSGRTRRSSPTTGRQAGGPSSTGRPASGTPSTAAIST